MSRLFCRAFELIVIYFACAVSTFLLDVRGSDALEIKRRLKVDVVDVADGDAARDAGCQSTGMQRVMQVVKYFQSHANCMPSF